MTATAAAMSIPVIPENTQGSRGLAQSSTVPSSTKPDSSSTIPSVIPMVFISDTGGSNKYDGSPMSIWPNAYPVEVNLRVGPEPSDAMIEVPIDNEETLAGIIEDNIVYTAEDRKVTNFSAPQTAKVKNFLYSRVIVYSQPVDANRNIFDGNLVIIQKPLFIGYITEYRYRGEGKSTTMRIKAEDARHFWHKCPVQGTLFENATGGKQTFIRAHSPVFNLGQKPNLRQTFGAKFVLAGEPEIPVFVNVNLNRYRNIPTGDDPTNPQNGLFIGDDQILDAANKGQLIEPFADRWLPANVWNYLRFVHSDELFNKISSGSIQEPTAATLGHALHPYDLPVSLTDVMSIAHLFDTGDIKDIFADWFFARSQTGGGAQTGTTIDTSAVGEFAPGGVMLGDVLFQLCRRVGNFTIGATFRRDGKLFVLPFRTTLSNDEDPSAGAGIAAGLGSSQITGVAPDESVTGKRSTLTLPATGDEKNTTQPEAASWDIKQGAKNYFNRFYYKGGRRFIQVTLSTVGKISWTDRVANTHAAYGTPPDSEWKPTTLEGTLEPGWQNKFAGSDQTKWETVYFAFLDKGTGDLDEFPDVYRTWVARDDIDWVDVWDQAAATPGYRMFFERDRQIASELLTRIFRRTGTPRNRPTRLQSSVWRAYQGIPVGFDAGGDLITVYGDKATVGNSVDNRFRWFRATPGFQLLTDGRFGFRLDNSARRDRTSVEDTAGDVVNRASTPWSWNGLKFPDNLPYEMFWTVAMEVDEDLFEFQSLLDLSKGEMSLRDYGPHMELMRSATEYGEERVVRSAIDNPFGEIHMTPFDPDNVTEKTVLYRNGQQEISARNQMTMNRHARADTEATIILPYIDDAIIPGQLIKTLEVPNGESINIGSIISAIEYNFLNQKTRIRLANIR